MAGHQGCPSNFAHTTSPNWRFELLLISITIYINSDFMLLKYCSSLFSKLYNKKKIIYKRSSKPVPIYQPYVHPLPPFQLFDHQSQISHQLTPNQLYLTQAKAMEIPFTGNLWNNQEVGYYHCAVCNNLLFTFSQKIKHSSGYASFYNSVKQAVQTYPSDQITRAKKFEQYEGVKCSKCNSHHGIVTKDGPPPTYLRFSINSGGLRFVKKQDFKDPSVQKILRRKLYYEMKKIRYKQIENKSS